MHGWDKLQLYALLLVPTIAAKYPAVTTHTASCVVWGPAKAVCCSTVGN